MPHTRLVGQTIPAERERSPVRCRHLVDTTCREYFSFTASSLSFVLLHPCFDWLASPSSISSEISREISRENEVRLSLVARREKWSYRLGHFFSSSRDEISWILFVNCHYRVRRDRNARRTGRKEGKSRGPAVNAAIN